MRCALVKLNGWRFWCCTCNFGFLHCLTLRLFCNFELNIDWYCRSLVGERLMTKMVETMSTGIRGHTGQNPTTLKTATFVSTIRDIHGKMGIITGNIDAAKDHTT